jgi:hypothetical protein
VRIHRRGIGAGAAALLVHALAFVVITRSDVRTRWPRVERAPISFEIVDVLPAPSTEEANDEPPKQRAAPAVPARAPAVEPLESAAPSVAERAPMAAGESIVRLKKDEGTIGKILGTHAPLSPGLPTLEGALDVRVDGPMSDAQRAARNATRHLQTDLADDVVTAGLADDYFRELRHGVETNWRPALKELNDGGASVTQVGMMRSFVDDRAAWDEMWRAYLDLAKLYAQGQRPKLETARAERLRELMRSRKGMFRFHAISELVLTQGPDGKVITIEMPLTSGHPGIDEGVVDAVAFAVDAMGDGPPARVHNGRSFSSTWRMRATWTMVPPTALLTGAGFDITPKGITVDVPFDIKLKTAVLLLRTDAHARASLGDASE